MTEKCKHLWEMMKNVSFLRNCAYVYFVCVHCGGSIEHEIDFAEFHEKDIEF